ncbi:three-Cys-motif partner protein TcmP [Tsukamurella sp. 8F]|uniref:three-Cys-motif partner protein TcmP n=1 Tax=unclassified Tsukamurella TaxID=2633480 RepID=UPI0023BA21B4|nr:MULTISPECIES: three-Cys-motif partner protein TcmP [unclassified Tsukamurella]MDF0528584.1 three-Cys-motif partner protein TcmP [Tsukamurella sp. 8J]MDF0585546.1 three-Cys-motif partner protein TcmP [Tsukamurella sp. 8F]
MATGTDAGLLESPKPQSVYKHAILEQYIIQYATMTASKLTPKRCVLFDGFAGRGRFDTGEAGSAEHMMVAAQKRKGSTQIDLLLVEQAHKDYEILDKVADEYRSRGIRIDSHHDDCKNRLDEMLQLAKQASLFVFLDPCGAVLPMDSIRDVLAKRGTWPRTEVLLNFNAGLIRRAGGQFKKGQLDLGGVAQADRVCGGEWWRDVAIRAHEDSGGQNWESAAEAVAHEYARRLTAATPYGSVVAPVRRQVHQQPIYYLILLTSQPHGFWVFGVSAAKAREKWIDFLGPDPDERESMLWDTVADQLERERACAIQHITNNLRTLTADGKPKKAVDNVHAIFGALYGEARETAFTAALRELVKSGELEYVTKGSKPRDFVFRRVS